MNIIFKTALCLGVGMLMTIGQPDAIVSVANASPQQCDGQVLAGAPQIINGQMAKGCDGNCATGNCSGTNGQCCGTCQGGFSQGGFGQGGCNGGCASGKCGCGGRLGNRLRNRRVCCPECEESFLPEEYCELEIKEGETEKTCFEVDFKTICIPKIVPPWKDDCCTPKCAEARSVKVLKKKKYKCPSCKYSWKVVKPELPPAPEVHPTPAVQPVPAGQPVPANQGYYNQQPFNPQQGVPVTPAGTIVPVKPQAPPVGKYFGTNNQNMQHSPQAAARVQQIQQQHQAQQMNQQYARQAELQLQRQAQLYRQQAAQPQAVPKTASRTNQSKAGGTLSDYYR